MLTVTFFLLYSLDPHLCLILCFLLSLSLQTDGVPLSFGAAFNQTYYLSLAHTNIYIYIYTYKLIYIYIYIYLSQHDCVYDKASVFIFNTNLEVIFFVCICTGNPFLSLFKCWMIFTSDLNVSLQKLKVQYVTLEKDSWQLSLILRIVKYRYFGLSVMSNH